MLFLKKILFGVSKHDTPEGILSNFQFSDFDSTPPPLHHAKKEKKKENNKISREKEKRSRVVKSGKQKKWKWNHWAPNETGANLHNNNNNNGNNNNQRLCFIVAVLAPLPVWNPARVLFRSGAFFAWLLASRRDPRDEKRKEKKKKTHTHKTKSPPIHPFASVPCECRREERL